MSQAIVNITNYNNTFDEFSNNSNIHDKLYKNNIIN